MAVDQTSVVLSPVTIGQQNKASLENSIIAAIQELQGLVNELEAQPVMELNANSSPTIAASAWTRATFPTTPNYSNGSGLSATTTGVQCIVAGRYQVQGTAVWAGNNTGARRLVGIAPSSVGSTGPDGTHYDTRAPLASLNTMSQSVNFELSLSVGDTVCLWVFHDATSSLVLSDARMSVRQMTD